MIRRLNKYRIEIDGASVRATPQQESVLRAMPDEQVARFIKIMGLDAGEEGE